MWSTGFEQAKENFPNSLDTSTSATGNNWNNNYDNCLECIL